MTALALGPAAAQTSGRLSNDVVRIGVLTDLGGVYADISGKGAVEAVKMAVEDFGGRMFAGRLNRASGQVRLLLPLEGLSALDAPGLPFHDPHANAALFQAIRDNFATSDAHRLVEVAAHINDPAFAGAVARSVNRSQPLECVVWGTRRLQGDRAFAGREGDQGLGTRGVDQIYRSCGIIWGCSRRPTHFRRTHV